LTVIKGKQFSTEDTTPEQFKNNFEGYDDVKKCKIYSYQGYDYKSDIPIAEISVLYVDYLSAVHN
jgi:hypothetical protein